MDIKSKRTRGARSIRYPCVHIAYAGVTKKYIKDSKMHTSIVCIEASREAKISLISRG